MLRVPCKFQMIKLLSWLRKQGRPRLGFFLEVGGSSYSSPVYYFPKTGGERL
jgi:hypothetical protein